MDNAADVAIVGAGLAGLACARDLADAGLAPILLEADDRPGGRVRSDRVDGFVLDRGFQVLLEAYPECRDRLDFGELDLRPFFPGARVRYHGDFHDVADPFVDPAAALKALGGPIGSLADKLKVATLARQLRKPTPDELLAQDAPSTLELLESEGFSSSLIDRFFRPFFGGVLLDPELSVSGRLFRYYFRMFSDGRSSLPAAGIDAIPRQMAEQLPEDCLRTGHRVHAVSPGEVRLQNGTAIRADQVVVAVEGPEASRLLSGRVDDPGSRSVLCLYWSAPRSPVDKGILVLDGQGDGPVANLAVPSAVAPGYAPPGQALISASIPGAGPEQTRDLETLALKQMRGWFGNEVDDWEPLEHRHIAHAQPRQLPSDLRPARRPVRVEPRLYVCGDHRDNASLNGALESGARAARAVLEDRS